MFDFTKLKKAVSDIGTQARDMRHRLEELRREREEVDALPIPRAEVTEKAVNWSRAQQHTFVRALGRSLRHMQAPGKAVPSHVSLVTATESGGGATVTQTAVLGFLATLCDELDARLPGKNKPLFEAVIARAVDAIADYPSETGPAMPERTKRLGEIDGEIAKLERQYTDMLGEAQAAGIRLQEG